MKSLTRIVTWSHSLLCEVLEPGGMVVDLTAGKGRDTLVLAEAVGLQGRIVAFDLQHSALLQTARLLRNKGFKCRFQEANSQPIDQPSVYLVNDCHSRIAKYLSHPIDGCIANLGYLPGGDTSLVTRPKTTLAALDYVMNRLRPGARLAVVVYPGHEGGASEGRAVREWFAGLSIDQWRVLRVDVCNRPEAPCLLVAERTHKVPITSLHLNPQK